MKHLLLFLAFIPVIPVFCQIIVADTSREYKTYTFVDQMPVYPGGEEEIMEFIQKNIRYPLLEKERNIYGRVLLSYMVNEDGSVSDISVKRSVSKAIDQEAIRVIKLLSKFTPAKLKGKDVRVTMIVPVTFNLPSRK